MNLDNLLTTKDSLLSCGRVVEIVINIVVVSDGMSSSGIFGGKLLGVRVLLWTYKAYTAASKIKILITFVSFGQLPSNFGSR